jgi:hypothetical protein
MDKREINMKVSLLKIKKRAMEHLLGVVETFIRVTIMPI